MSELTFHEFKHGMTVMDGKQCVAVARPTQSYGWVLRVHNGSWIDPRARTQGLIPGKYPNLMNLRTRPSTRNMMRGLLAPIEALTPSLPK